MKMLFREQRGSYAESMKTVEEIANTPKAVAAYARVLLYEQGLLPHDVIKAEMTPERVKCEFYTRDVRGSQWESTYILTTDWFHMPVIGFCTAQLNGRDEPLDFTEWHMAIDVLNAFPQAKQFAHAFVDWLADQPSLNAITMPTICAAHKEVKFTWEKGKEKYNIYCDSRWSLMQTWTVGEMTSQAGMFIDTFWHEGTQRLIINVASHKRLPALLEAINKFGAAS